MPSVAEGYGQRFGQAAELPMRNVTAWDVMSQRTKAMTSFERRRFVMLVLNRVAHWNLSEIGEWFKLCKGHVSREIDRASREMSSFVADMPVNIAEVPEPRERISRPHRVDVSLADHEFAVLAREASRRTVCIARQAREWMLTGCLLASGVERDRLMRPHRIKVGFASDEIAVLARKAKEQSVCVSAMARQWMLAGGLVDAIRANGSIDEGADDAEQATDLQTEEDSQARHPTANVFTTRV